MPALILALLLTTLSGAAPLRLQIEKLSRLGKVLHIAAHPDDENTAFLAFSARGWQYRTAYLSLTRGEGGQNLIGSEQGEWMGLIRTQELLAARRIDGAEQYFTRAIDFGFSKTASETLTKWDREKILGDVVYHIRNFQPDIIVLRFSGTPRDGHGQHQASAILAKEAFIAAADPEKFPGQGKPWQPKRLLLNIPVFTPAMAKEAEASPNKLTLNVGIYDPVLGQSFGEIAGISRSQHRSQAMGWRQEPGQMREFFQVVAGTPADKDLMEGIDTTWARVPNSSKVAALLTQAKQQLDDRAPEKIVPILLEARRELANTYPASIGKRRIVVCLSFTEIKQPFSSCASYRNKTGCRILTTSSARQPSRRSRMIDGKRSFRTATRAWKSASNVITTNPSVAARFVITSSVALCIPSAETCAHS